MILAKFLLLNYILFFFSMVRGDEILQIPDPLLSNRNQIQYPQVPTDVLILAKLQAYEPMYISSGDFRGFGFYEPMFNLFIANIKKKGIETYVDYITTAKTYFYIRQKHYNICRSQLRSFKKYKEYQEDLLKNNNRWQNKFMAISKPYVIVPPTGRFAILKKNAHLFEKHKFKNSSIYNIKSILDDEKLKTIQIKDMTSGIQRYIYPNIEQEHNIIEKYKKRVYEFVSSHAEQMLLMLNGERMHYVDITIVGDFYATIYHFYDKMLFLEYAHKHPNHFTKNDYQLSYIRCHGEKLPQLLKAVQQIDEIVFKVRGNRTFWQKVFNEHTTKLNLKPISIDHFYYLRESFMQKKIFQSGLYD